MPPASVGGSGRPYRMVRREQSWLLMSSSSAGSFPTIVRACLWIAAAGCAVWWVRATLNIELPATPEAPPLAHALTIGGGPTVTAIAMKIDGHDVDRVEVNRSVTLMATAEPSKAVSSLHFVWAVSVGELRGDGPVVTWHLPKGLSTPIETKSTLEVIERSPDFSTGVPPRTREQSVKVDGPVLLLNDSWAELSRMAHAFLVDLFGNSSVSPEATLVDFSDTCRGKEDELGDVQINLRQWLIHSAESAVTAIEFDSSMSSATVTSRCTFRDVERETGREHITEADCVLTAVYRRPRWWLCDSYTSHGTHRYLSEPTKPAAPS